MSNSLADMHPELASEWSDKNLPLTPDKITYGSNKIVWWKAACGHEWEASVKSRTVNGTGCPYCSHNKVLEGFNDLATVFPQIATEWSEKNYPLLPMMVTPFANRKAEENHLHRRKNHVREWEQEAKTEPYRFCMERRRRVLPWTEGGGREIK